MTMKIFFTLLTSVSWMIATAQQYHDAAIFNAPNGDVKYIEFNEGRVTFTKNGKIDKANSPYLSFFKKYVVKYDKQWYPISVTTDFDETKIEYDDQHRIIKREVKGSSNYLLEYEYVHETIKETKTVLENGRPVKSSITYDIITYDDRNNLTSRGIVGESHTSTSVTYEQIGLVTTGYLAPQFHQTTIVEGHVENDRVIGYYTNNVFESGMVDTDVSFETAMHPFCMNVYNPKNLLRRIKSSKYHYRTGKFVKKYINIEQPSYTFYGHPIVDMTAGYYSSKEILDYTYLVTFDNVEQRNDFIVFFIEQLKDQGFTFERINLKNGIRFEYNFQPYKNLQRVIIHRRVSIIMDELSDKTPCMRVSWCTAQYPDEEKHIPHIKWKDMK